MNVEKTSLKDLFIIKPRVFKDTRGFFMESYNKERYQSLGINNNFIQDNLSSSQYGVIRGLHYQDGPHSQAKMIQVIKGSILDVAVDLRKGSPTYLKHIEILLTSENMHQVLIPKGFAHGFSVLSEEVLFSYKCDNLYHPESEGGIRYDDPDLAINWRIKPEDAIVSDKDIAHPLLKEAQYKFTY